MTRGRPVRAIFLREFHWQRPGTSYGFGAKPGPDPQFFPRDFIAAAIAAGAAVAVPKRRAKAPGPRP